MTQLGFVIDHSRCIGCHACTVACKSENDVPLGDFRTWVKYTEEGEFPKVKRNFAVLRCNQCTDAPCVEICPVAALAKRPDGIVDIDPELCIGCKGCMQACPYDALYINDETGTAEKCHFCAHRVEVGLAPACAVVCPTEAIIPGDFHDPLSQVSRMRATGQLTARKTEAQTGPNVYYREAHPAGLDPTQASAASGYIWADQSPHVQYLADAIKDQHHEQLSRTVYNVEHPPVWGSKVSAYLWTKSLSAGAFLGLLPVYFFAEQATLSFWPALLMPSLALIFLALTTVLLIADLKRPERFHYILLHPNWSSWLAKGSVVLIAYSMLLLLALSQAFIGFDLGQFGRLALLLALTVTGSLTACYTAWLFKQSKGRVLWMKQGFAWHLIAQATLAGTALYLLLTPVVSLVVDFTVSLNALRWFALMSLGVHAFYTMAEDFLAPAGREREYAQVMEFLEHGPYAQRHWRFGIILGMFVPAALLLVNGAPVLWALASICILVGLAIEEDIFVHVGQALPIS